MEMIATLLTYDNASRDDNVYHVVSGGSFNVPYLNNTARLDGFTIKGGQANGTSSTAEGAGLYINGHPALANLIITDNLSMNAGTTGADGREVASYLRGAPTLSNIVVQNNAASFGGGGWIISIDGIATLSQVGLISNQVSGGGTKGAGGGLYLATGNSILDDVDFIDNTAAGNLYQGGGLYIEFGSPSLNNVSFTNNSADPAIPAPAGVAAVCLSIG